MPRLPAGSLQLAFRESVTASDCPGRFPYLSCDVLQAVALSHQRHDFRLLWWQGAYEALKVETCIDVAAFIFDCTLLFLSVFVDGDEWHQAFTFSDVAPKLALNLVLRDSPKPRRHCALSAEFVDCHHRA